MCRLVAFVRENGLLALRGIAHALGERLSIGRKKLDRVLDSFSIPVDVVARGPWCQQPLRKFHKRDHTIRRSVLFNDLRHWIVSIVKKWQRFVFYFMRRNVVSWLDQVGISSHSYNSSSDMAATLPTKIRTSLGRMVAELEGGSKTSPSGRRIATMITPRLRKSVSERRRSVYGEFERTLISAKSSVVPVPETISKKSSTCGLISS